MADTLDNNFAATEDQTPAGEPVILRDARLLQNGEPSAAMLRSCIREYQEGETRRDKLYKYFTLQHDITGRQRAQGLPNNKLVHDFPGYIVAMATGYLVGNAVSYSTSEEAQKKALEILQKAYNRDSVESVDSELATDASVFGAGVEVDYMGQDSMPHAAKVDRRQAFVVYDATVEQAPLFGVYWLPRLDEEGKKSGLRAWVYTSSYIIPYEGITLDTLTEVEAIDGQGGRQQHFFGVVPLIEYWNNPQMAGDFEKVITLIDAYNMLQSDRVNDKSQFVDAILVLIGVTGGIAPATNPEDKRTPAQRLRDDRLLNLPPNAKAEWLAKQLDEADVEVLKNAIKSDIHKFSQVPDLTDEKFAGNSSGVAMRYKLLGLEQLTKVKERWFREGLRWRRRAFCNALATKGVISTADPEAIEETFTRSLPVNEVEIAQMVKDLQGIVPDEILLAQVPFVSDVQKALEMLIKQKAEAAELQKKAFGDYPDANENGGAAGQGDKSGGAGKQEGEE